MNTPRSLTLIKFFPPLLLLAAFVFSTPPSMAATTGSGRVITEARTVSDFNAITMKGSMKLEVRQTGRESLSISADDNILPLIETKVEADGSDRVLHIQFKRDASIATHREIKVVIEVIKLNAVSNFGSGDIRIDGVKGPLLKLAMLGAGDLSARGLALDALSVRIAGSGDVRGEGSAKQVTLNIAGSGDAALADVVASEVNVTIAGSGDAKVHATKSLTVRVAGSGDVQYCGGATEIHKTVMGSGSVKPMK